MHREQPIAEAGCLVHRVRNRHRRQILAGYDLLGHADHLVPALGVERCGVLVEQQQPRPQLGCHQQSKSLPLTSRKGPDWVIEAVLETHAELKDALLEFPL